VSGQEVARIQATCCIAGGGPAGMMLGLLLARAGVDVLVLEKHGDFLRDFRGDTIHPSTLEVMAELGLLERFLARPHQEVRKLRAQIGDADGPVADFTHLPTRCKFLAFMPQWDFLDFLAENARAYASFRLLMEAEVTGLRRDETTGRVIGVTARMQGGDVDIESDLVVDAEGRHSSLRQMAGFTVIELGAPMDVLWFRISRKPGEASHTFGHADRGGLLVTIDRGDYWQCALVITKGSFPAIEARGLDAFRGVIARLSPLLADRTDEIRGWDDVKLLSVALDRAARWHQAGMLLIGDAAHAMTPIGGVGINLAVQDAVAAANILAEKLRRRTVTEADLAAVQRRRDFPTRATQSMQRIIQERLISRVLAGRGPVKPPLPVRLIYRFPILQRIPARVVGIGFRPEHVAVGAHRA
jgi:2-polyprenyl-6-methoxyphenol hydroxylase-like FAD-dependent oxidoreductase